MDVLKAVLAAAVFIAAFPLLAGCYQFLLASLHRWRRLGREVGDVLPRVAIVIPAWNEAAVLDRTLDTLMRLEYPADRIRAYVVDDASTDETPALVAAAALRHGGDRIRHIRRDNGGQGKAHTINHGLEVIEAEGWFEAVLVIDADVLFTPPSLRRMVRHFADPAVGAVTAYIKEGSRPANYMNRFVAFEYITAQAAARRALNVLGAQACLAGGAQLLSRDALTRAGGRIDTSSLAEDTFTTLNVQLAGMRVVFEPNAIVWAEEPRGLTALWRQRLRWGRGNVQVTRHFSGIWLRRRRAGRLGSVSFALVWFSVLLMPVFLVIATTSLLILHVIEPGYAGDTFRYLYLLNVFTYLFVTLSAFNMDPSTAKACWREGFCFPGLIALVYLVWAVDPDLVRADWFLVFGYVWISASMLAAWLVKQLEATGRVRWLVAPLLYLVGYGPLLCAITAAAYAKEIRGTAMVWEKTEKTGAIGELA